MPLPSLACRVQTACVALIACAAVAVSSAQSSAPSIVFLHLRSTDSGIELLDAKTARGLLRVAHYAPAAAGLHFEVRAANQQVLFRDVCPEPTTQHLEYEDPDQPGHILTKQLPVVNTEFTVRIPQNAEAKTVRFFRHPPIPPHISRPGSAPEMIAAGEITLPKAAE